MLDEATVLESAPVLDMIGEDDNTGITVDDEDDMAVGVVNDDDETAEFDALDDD